MSILVLGLSIIQSMAVSLGVGGSTLAILNFFHAIADGKIDETERNFMGVTYIVLRVAMGVILVSTLLLVCIGYAREGAAYFTGSVAAQCILIAVLYLNAYLMTIRLMPSTFGPAIQASSWYAQGFLFTLYAHDIENINILVFLFAYATFIFFAISFVNSIMAYLKEKNMASTQPPAPPVAQG